MLLPQFRCGHTALCDEATNPKTLGRHANNAARPEGMGQCAGQQRREDGPRVPSTRLELELGPALLGVQSERQ